MSLRCGWKAALSVLALAAIRASAAEEAAVEKPAAVEVQVLDHLFADSVEFSAEGRCLAGGKKAIRSWQVPGFPASIPHFESCTTVQAKGLSGEVEFSMKIVDGVGKRLQKVEGVMVLSEEGKASQAAEWDHVQIPSAGTYFLVISVAGVEAKRIPLVFTGKRSSRSRKPK